MKRLQALLKKLLIISLIGVIFFAFGACGGNDSPIPPSGGNPGEGTQPPGGTEQPPEPEQPNEPENPDEPNILDVRFTRDYFENKKVVSYGDSISARAYVDEGKPDYLENLADALGFTFTRLGVRASRLTAVLDNPQNVRSGVDLISSNQAANAAADVAFIAYGTNDFPSNVPIGADNHNFERWEDVSTFKGAINFAVKTLRAHNPDIRIVFFTPIYRNDRALNGKNVPLTAYCRAIEELAEQNEYRAVNMYANVGFNAENFGAGGALTPDGLHPNAEGHKMMSDYILQFADSETETPDEEKPPIPESPIKFMRAYFEGKTVVSYGDSISSYATMNPGEKDYIDCLSDALGFTATHLGRGGSRLTGKLPVAHATRTGVDLMTQNSALNAAADVAIVAYGTNDFTSNVPLGTAADDFVRWQDVDTFMGAVNFAVKTLKAHNPDIEIVFLTPIYRNDQLINGINLLLPDYCSALTERAVALGCRVVEMYNGVGFNRDNFYRGSVYTSDALHPNALGQAQMAKYILGLDN